MKKWIFLLAFLFAATGLAASAVAQTVTVEAAWARPTPPSAHVGGAFMRLRGGAVADRLIAAASPVAEVVELHTHSMDGGIAKMRAVSAIDLAAGALVELRPGGFHLMLIRLKAPLKVGDTVPIRLRFEQAGEVSVRALVTKDAPGSVAGSVEGSAPPAGHGGDHSEHRH